MKRALTALIAILMCSTSFAQVRGGIIRSTSNSIKVVNALITLTPPTSATDGTSLTGNYALSSIELFISQSPIVDSVYLKPSVVLVPDMGVMPTTYEYIGVQPFVTLYVRAKACNINGCSSLGKEISKTNGTNDVAVPNAPGISIQFEK